MKERCGKRVQAAQTNVSHARGLHVGKARHLGGRRPGGGVAKEGVPSGGNVLIQLRLGQPPRHVAGGRGGRGGVRHQLGPVHWEAARGGEGAARGGGMPMPSQDRGREGRETHSLSMAYSEKERVAAGFVARSKTLIDTRRSLVNNDSSPLFTCVLRPSLVRGVECGQMSDQRVPWFFLSALSMPGYIAAAWPGPPQCRFTRRRRRRRRAPSKAACRGVHQTLVGHVLLSLVPRNHDKVLLPQGAQSHPSAPEGLPVHFMRRLVLQRCGPTRPRDGAPGKAAISLQDALVHICRQNSATPDHAHAAP